MPDGSIVKDASDEAREELRKFLARREVPAAQLLEDEISASAFANKCAREWAEQDREKAHLNTVEMWTTESLELVVSAIAGPVSTWKTSRGVRAGEWFNGLSGAVAKVVALTQPESRPLRVAARAGKVLLHSQISMLTRNLTDEST